MGEVLKIGQENEIEPISFEDFWTLYPRRVAKKEALKAWNRIDPSQHTAILIAVVAWRSTWLARDLQYTPHPATWLNGERWTDELPQSLHSSHARAESPVAGPRSAMPEHVRALLARLRK